MSYPVKQVIVMRADLGMRKGKMIAQGAHASLKVFFDRGVLGRDENRYPEDSQKNLTENIFKIQGLTPDMVTWIEGSFAKVCVRADSEEELLELYRKAQKAGFPCALITDAGRTEFGGVPTNTCIAIGPAKSESVDLITGHLKLL